MKNATRIIVLALVCLTLASACATVKTRRNRTFATPEKAVDAFVQALRVYDLPKLVSIFGEDAQRLFESEDAVADQKIRTDFLTRYDESHVLATREDGARTLIVGKDGWPLPFPIVNSEMKWSFDTTAGIEEIIDRRIGRNELKSIQTCLAVADAQREYYSEDRDGDGILEFAQRLKSTAGSHDGLYWPSDEKELSPLGELVATAADEGYTAASGSYHGYHYRLLSSQGPAAPGGAYNFMARDNQIGGFAVLAYPAAYGDSGIMTFIVSHKGIVYQKDLGEATAQEALKIATFDPGEGWTKVAPKDLEPIPGD